MLLHSHDGCESAQVTHVRAALDAAEWTDGRETVGVQGAKVKRNLQLPDASPLRLQLGQMVLAALAKSPLYHAAALPLRTLPPRFNRYEGGGEYGFHVDGAVMGLTAEAQLRSDVSRSEEHTSELQSLMRISYAVFCLKKKNKHNSPDK